MLLALGYFGCIALAFVLAVVGMVCTGPIKREVDRAFPVVALLGLLFLALGVLGVGPAPVNRF